MIKIDTGRAVNTVKKLAKRATYNEFITGFSRGRRSFPLISPLINQ